MTRVICFCGQKGGAGKSTLAIAVATELRRRGWRVLLIDADAQRTTATWAEVAAELERGAPDVVSMRDEMRRTLPALAPSYDVVIIDCPGRNGRRVTMALGIADLAILPCGPTAPHVWAMGASIDQVRDVQAARRRVRRPLDAAIVVTQKQPRTVVGREARRALDGAELDLLRTELDYRVTYGEALADGTGPSTYQPSSIAARETRALTTELEHRLGLSRKGTRNGTSKTDHRTPPRQGRITGTRTQAQAGARRGNARARPRADRAKARGRAGRR